MKLARNNSQVGSTLVITLVGGILIGTILCSYLVLVVNRNTMAMRGTAWNTAMPVLEAGIEEALTHLHSDSNNPTANNWTADPVNAQTVRKQRDFVDGSSFLVTISNFSSTAPVIFSVGNVRSPLKSTEYISRTVQVTTTNHPGLFLKAIAANGAISLAGNAVVDGFNSSLGFYDVSTNRALGEVGTDSKGVPAISVSGGALLYGRAVTGAGGKVYVASGAVGDFDWNNANTGIEPGWTNDDMYVQFPSNSPPAGPFLTPQVVSANGSNITVLGNGTYILPNFNSNSKKKPMIVTGNATLLVTDYFYVSGNSNNAGYVYIEPGASLNLYVGGTASMGGGGVVNATGLPANLSFFGLSSNTSLNYSGTADFVGTINAPQADVGISGGASIYGAVICNSFTSGGNSSVHYDQALGGPGFFLVTSWREL